MRLSAPFRDQAIWLKYNYSQLSGPGYYDIRVLACNDVAYIGNMDSITRYSNAIPVYLAGWDAGTCLTTCCTKNAVHGYSQIIMVKSGLTGVEAQLETRYGKLCRQDYSGSDTAFSVSTLGVGYENSEGAIIWAQIGCGVQRNQLASIPAYTPFIYGELVDYSQEVRYLLQPGVIYEGETHSYRIMLDQNSGTWFYYFDDVLLDTLMSDDWKRTGNLCQWGGEVLNWEDDMAGTEYERCLISQCRFRDDIYHNANFFDTTSYFIDTTSDAEWGISVESQTSFDIWDKNPIP